MSDKQRNLAVICLLVLIASFVGIYLYFGPSLRTETEQKSAKQAELDSVVEHIKSVNNLKVILPDLQNANDTILRNAIPEGDQWPVMIEQIEKMILSQNKFVTSTFTIDKNQNTQVSGGTSEIQFTLNLSGKFSDIDSLFNLINNNVRPMNIKSFSITAPKLTPGYININLTVTTFGGAKSAAASKSTDKSTTPTNAGAANE